MDALTQNLKNVEQSVIAGFFWAAGVKSAPNKRESETGTSQQKKRNVVLKTHTKKKSPPPHNMTMHASMQ